MSEAREFSLDLTREEGYAFEVEFDQAGMPVLHVDEAAPIGQGTGPNPARLLGTAVGHCLSASLLFCLQKARVEVHGLSTRVSGRIVRNQAGRFRVEALRVVLAPGIAPEDRERIGRCLEIFQDFCIVTESVRGGLDVEVDVEVQEPQPAG